jgi:hypothetical protein
MKTMFTPREPPPPPAPCEECVRLEEAWLAEQDRVLEDSRVIARMTGLLRRLSAAVALHPPYGSADEQAALRALLRQVDDALDREA